MMLKASKNKPAQAQSGSGAEKSSVKILEPKIAGTQKSKKMRKSYKVLIFVLIVFLFFGAVYFAIDRAGYFDALRLGRQVQMQMAQQEADKVVLDSLKRIILLPEEITPTVALINDVEVLREQQPEFFANAKNGDRVIFYPTFAIVYDLQANKIINLGPVKFETETEQSPEMEEAPLQTEDATTVE